jgi:PAS domain S-box-containing protein
MLGAAITNMEESVVITDADLDSPGPRILFVNNAYTRITGYTPDEVIGKNPRFMQGPRTDRAVLNVLRERLKAGESFEGETYNYRKDGREFLLHWHISPVRNLRGKITHFVAVQVDLTQRRQMEAELLQSRKLRALGEILGGLTHEFNNLLQPMLIQMQMLSRHPSVTPDIMELMQPIQLSAVHATELCKRVLSMSRKSSDQVEITPFDTSVASTVELFRSSLDRRIELSLELDTPECFVQASRTQLQQIVLNLCLNARDTLLEKYEQEPVGTYTPHLLVRTKTAKARRPVREGGEQSKFIDAVCVAVIDNGLGMRDDVIERIYEPFFTTKAGSRGTGLGLSGVWAMLHDIGGWIDVKSSVGNGSVFEAFVPISLNTHTSEPVASLTPSPKPTQKSQSLKILIVEDNALVARSFLNLLRAENHEVELCEDGAAAWEFLRERHAEFDVVLSDLNMPRLTGSTLANLLASIPYKGRLLLISGYVSDADMKVIKAAGCAEVLKKPIQPDVLVNVIAETKPNR